MWIGNIVYFKSNVILFELSTLFQPTVSIFRESIFVNFL